MDLFRDERIKEINNANASANQLADSRYKESNIKAKAQEEANKYNELKNSIAEPLSVAFLHPTAEKLLSNYVKPGIKKVLGRATQEVGQAGRTIASNLVQGRNPAEGLGEQFNRNLSDARSAVRATTDDIQGNISDSARAQLRMSKRSINPSRGAQPQPEPARPTQPDSNVKAQSSDDLGSADRATLTNITEDDGDDLVSRLASGKLTGGEAQRAIQGRSVLEDFRQQTGDLREGDNVPTSLQAQPERAQGSGIRSSARVDPFGDEQTSRITSTNAQNAGDTFRQGEASTNPAQPPDAQAQQSRFQDRLKSIQPEAGEDALPGTLATTAEEVEVAGGGPEDIFTDIISGVMAIGSLIAGADNKSANPVLPPRAAPMNAGVQYGI